MKKSKSLTKEQIREDILGLNTHRILCELPTGTGKTRVALEFMKEKQLTGNILVVIPRLVLIEEWKKEFIKWGCEDYLPRVTFSTYVSIPKHSGETYDLVIYDEAHHLSERAREGAENITSEFTVLLSATVGRTLKSNLRCIWPELECYTISIKQAIKENILPDPRVFLIPLHLVKYGTDCSFIINPKAKGKAIPMPYSKRFACAKDKEHKYEIQCSQQQYYENSSFWTSRYKSLYQSTCKKQYYFNWQRVAGDRLKWLAEIKSPLIKKILKKVEGFRTLTFCSSIEQTRKLGEYCINSEEKDSAKHLADFNAEKISHITACNMLNEGVNLVNCQIGIFVSINSSDIMVKQKNGRILRHPEPVLIIPYYVDTREEELVNEMVQTYNKDLITLVDSLDKLTL